MRRGSALIVDDEESIRITCREFLEDEGWIVATAADVAQARRRVEACDFDIAFVDVILNGGSGIELLDEIRSRSPTTRVVIITGVPSVDTACAAIRLGAADYIVKPLRQDLLLAVADSALRSKVDDEVREASRRLMEAIVRSLGDGVIAVDTRLHLLAANPAAEALCRLDGTTPGLRDPANWTRGCSGACLEPLREAIAGARTVQRSRLACRARHAPEQVVQVEANILESSDGSLLGGIASVRGRRLSGA